MPRDYRFRKMTRADYSMVRGWLEQPHVAAWWGDPGTEHALMDRDIDGDATDMRIVELEGHAFAYVQDYDARQSGSPQYADLPRGSRGMDTFLGDPVYLGQGHGARYLAQRARQLLDAGAPLVAVDPDPQNHVAIAAYRRAGFRLRCETTGDDGEPVQVMALS